MKASKKIRIVMRMNWIHCYFCFLLLLKASVVIKTLYRDICMLWVISLKAGNLHWFLKIAQECSKISQEKFSDWYKALFHYFFFFFDHIGHRTQKQVIIRICWSGERWRIFLGSIVLFFSTSTLQTLRYKRDFWIELPCLLLSDDFNCSIET